MDLSQHTASQAWGVVSERVGAFVDAWDAGGEPPRLADFLPEGEPELRRLTLVELIKVDLGYRWSRPAERMLLEDYLAEFPELADGGELPCDLIYEEFYVRKQAGAAVDLARRPRLAPWENHGKPDGQGHLDGEIVRCEGKFLGEEPSPQGHLPTDEGSADNPQCFKIVARNGFFASGRRQRYASGRCANGNPGMARQVSRHMALAVQDGAGCQDGSIPA